MRATSQDPTKFNDYEGFVEKFKSKKTTDDCYTPSPIYNAVYKWVNNNILPLDGVEVVRPFVPGGDYEHFDYPEGCVVLDNPPFSIFMEICRTLQSRGIRFFLFAPGMTSVKKEPWLTTVIIGTSIKYENGADVATSFVTNILGGDPKIIVAGDLSISISNANKIVRQEKKKRQIPVFDYPPHITSAALLRKIAVRGVNLSISATDCAISPSLDCKIGGFGNMLLLSEKAAADKAAAEKAAVEKAAAEKAAVEKAAAVPKIPVTLSARELEIIRNLG